jgi:hypothetical protein
MSQNGKPGALGSGLSACTSGLACTVWTCHGRQGVPEAIGIYT